MPKKRVKSFSKNNISCQKKPRLHDTDDVIQSKEDILLPVTFKDNIMEAICSAYKYETYF